MIFLVRDKNGLIDHKTLSHIIYRKLLVQNYVNSRLDKKSIRNFLTIRYNPLERPIESPISWRNFKNDTNDPTGTITEKLLLNSISKIRTTKDSSFVVSLSSGIDSSLCLALLRKAFPDKKIVAVCGVFRYGFDESGIAKEIANKFNADFKLVSIDSIFTNMPELISVTGKPRWNTYQHLIAREARKYGHVMVTGDGADEIFGGYTFRYSKFLNLLRPTNNWKIKAINYLECHNRDWVPDQESLFGSILKFDWNEIYNYFRSYFSNSLHPLQQVMLADYNGKLLFDFLPSGIAISRYYGIDSFMPFRDPSVIDFALRLPIDQQYDHINEKGKLVLRKIAKRLGVEHIQEKKGFSPDVWYDWKDHGKKICQNFLLQENSHIFKKKLINYNWVLRSFERVENDGDIRYLFRLISIFALEIWYKIFITKEMKSTTKLS